MNVNEIADEKVTRVTLPECQGCYKTMRLPRGQRFCMDCRRRELETSLMMRTDDQRRAEYQSGPEGHTLPNITIPLMQNRIPVQQPNQQLPQYQPTPITNPQPNLKLDEIRARIEELKRQVN